MPAYAARWQALVPHATVVEIAGGSHMVPAEHPAELAAALSHFLANFLG